MFRFRWEFNEKPNEFHNERSKKLNDKIKLDKSI